MQSPTINQATLRKEVSILGNRVVLEVRINDTIHEEGKLPIIAHDIFLKVKDKVLFEAIGVKTDHVRSAINEMIGKYKFTIAFKEIDEDGEKNGMAPEVAAIIGLLIGDGFKGDISYKDGKRKSVMMT